jgi:hypothetical protein
MLDFVSIMRRTGGYDVPELGVWSLMIVITGQKGIESDD